MFLISISLHSVQDFLAVRSSLYNLCTTECTEYVTHFVTVRSSLRICFSIQGNQRRQVRYTCIITLFRLYYDTYMNNCILFTKKGSQYTIHLNFPKLLAQRLDSTFALQFIFRTVNLYIFPSIHLNSKVIL